MSNHTLELYLAQPTQSEEEATLIYASEGAENFENVTGSHDSVSDSVYCTDATTVMSEVLSAGVDNVVSRSYRS